MPHTTHRSITSSLFALTLIALSALGCGDLTERLSSNENGNSGNTAVLESNTAPEAKSGPMDAGLCANEYYPVDPSIKREYRITGDAAANYVLTQEPAGEDGFAEIREFGSGLT